MKPPDKLLGDIVSKTIRLAIYFNDKLQTVRKLAVPFVVGRSHDADLTIPHPMVSRRHCRIFEENGTFRLQDLGSLNGTCIGQERVKDCELRDGTEFQIGSIRFVFNPADVHADAMIAKMEELSGDLPPPLPSGDAMALQPIPTTSSVAQVAAVSPGFIKPLPVYFPIQDEADDILEIQDVIDLADVTDKEASTPPVRERK